MGSYLMYVGLCMILHISASIVVISSVSSLNIKAIDLYSSVLYKAYFAIFCSSCSDAKISLLIFSSLAVVILLTFFFSLLLMYLTF